MNNTYKMLNGSLTSKTIQNIEISTAEGCYLYDTENNKYIDLVSGLWNVSLGYSPDLNERVKKSFNKLLNNNLAYVDMTAYSHELYNNTSGQLIKFLENKFTNILFTNSGSESIELSLKIIQALNKEDKYIYSFQESYHGTYYGSLSVSGLVKDISNNHKVNSSYNMHLNIPNTKQEEAKFIEDFKKNLKNIHGLIIEPIIGSGGIKYASINFYNEIMELCKHNDIIVVFDEVATGFYRTGSKFFHSKLDFKPDILCLSKGINNGILPSGCVAINSKIEKKLEKHSGIKHMSTQNGNLLCQSSINQTIQFYNEENDFLIANTNELENIFYEQCNKYNISGRGKGAMLSIPIKSNNLEMILETLKENGVLIYRFYGENEKGISLFPHLNMDPAIFKKSVKFLMKTINKYECLI
ncbi:adenosylmethionine-8-amino-7-oxononanoate aminotransferase [Staphylococcus epidermidis]|uniref:aminotransferase class III-fold pyridoxal phosphate-dependent enzyme n=1 Tax=Staphylococcus epidermidis TaxID=1282 RepID=UPI001932CB75|nr:aminotransferase class III-fold pyridoxal phosphate-dependent enzyme [Staphylococcus epidermidis]MBM0848343.1 aminotransferase class III-fold pyridoxal phosphate-dependent enzyme [Staphylococcus epidermidis]